jgi:Tfp pilus assembly protein PilN
MNTVARPRSTALLALAAFGAALLPLAAATAYYHYRVSRIAGEVDALENQLGELNKRLDPIGNLDQLRSQMLARGQIVDALQRPQRGLQAAVAISTQLPAGVQLLALDVDEKRLTLQARCADAAAAAALLRQVGDAGFSDPAIAARNADGSAERITLEAGLDPSRFAAPAAGEVTR